MGSSRRREFSREAQKKKKKKKKKVNYRVTDMTQQIHPGSISKRIENICTCTLEKPAQKRSQQRY